MGGIHPEFFQNPPELMNPFADDPLLRAYLRFRLPKDHEGRIGADLMRFGERVLSDFPRLAERAERETPRHIPFDPWGRRIDVIETSDAWQRLHEISAEEGLVAIGYERPCGEFSRLWQFAKLYLFHPVSAFYTCPLAMTDGAARVIELSADPVLGAKAFKHLTTRDPVRFWTSGQWMTERTGGSDVSGTSTVARREAEGGYRLYGDKWFTSATTSQMTMALAKIEGASDPREGLSLFYAELRDETGGLQKIQIQRLKDKLGTKALPTAELRLEGLPARLIGDPGEGVKRVASLLNITRLYNSVTSLGTMARAMALAKDYSRKRVVFSRRLSEQPLHLRTLADLEAEFEATFILGFHLVHLLGREEVGTASVDEKKILRLMTPVVKLWSAKQCMALVSEVIEVFGGAGYIEDTGLPKLLRDSQVFSIWEGTTNVLSLDVLRAMAKEHALESLVEDLRRRLSSFKSDGLRLEREKIERSLALLQRRAEAFVSVSSDLLQAGARAFALSLARVSSAVLLLEFVEHELARGAGDRELEVVRTFCRKPLVDLPDSSDLDGERAHLVVFGSRAHSKSGGG